MSPMISPRLYAINYDDPFSPPDGVSLIKFKILLWKRYFETGDAVVNYAKYLIVLFGLSFSHGHVAMAFGVLYGFACLVLGRYWHRHGFMQIEMEIANRFNIFTTEMRRSIRQ